MFNSRSIYTWRPGRSLERWANFYEARPSSQFVHTNALARAGSGRGELTSEYSVNWVRVRVRVRVGVRVRVRVPVRVRVRVRVPVGVRALVRVRVPVRVGVGVRPLVRKRATEL